MDKLTDILKRIIAFRDERDWSQFHTPKNLSAALAIEASELQEVLLWKTDTEIQEFLSEPSNKARLTRELADVLIYALLLCIRMESDPIEIINRKLEENAKKYPVELAKGSAAKYDELLTKRSDTV
jgi:NTP pyrophosphatase (non-canonical NTP hydrolase)